MLKPIFKKLRKLREVKRLPVKIFNDLGDKEYL